jgi:ATP-dependent Clp protease protease subunit
MGGTTRVASKYTRFLLHEVTSISYGKVSELKEGVEELEKLNEMLDEIIAQRSKLTLALLSKKTKKREWWLSSEEALKNGIIDGIV